MDLQELLLQAEDIRVPCQTSYDDVENYFTILCGNQQIIEMGIAVRDHRGHGVRLLSTGYPDLNSVSQLLAIIFRASVSFSVFLPSLIGLSLFNKI